MKIPNELLSSYARTLRRPDGVMMIVEDGSVGIAIADALDELVQRRIQDAVQKAPEGKD